MRYTVNLTNPNQPRVQDVLVKGEDGIYRPIDPAVQYSLVTTSYLAHGGDLYTFEGAEQIIDTGHLDAEVFLQYVREQSGGMLNILENSIEVLD
jgi:2',3'-cyclic-nucleotide 2'-phosphodiesterase (5'-nucleotidase family)